MDPSQHPAEVAFRSMGPIGVVAAPGPGGPVGIGIGIMSATQHSQMVAHQLGHGYHQPQNYHHQQQPQQHQQKKLVVSPDSSDDKDNFVAQLFAHHNRTSPTDVITSLQNSIRVQQANHHMTWSNPPLLPSSMASPYPVMGVGVMGNPAHGLSDHAANVIYGLIGPPASAVPNHQNNISMNNSSSATVHIPQSQVQPSVLSGLSSTMTSAVLPEGGMMMVESCESSSSSSSRHQHQQHPIMISSPNTAAESQLQLQPVKEIIHCKHVTLFPPNVSAPPPTTREKPPGCRTVFVGGLPENVTDDLLVREIFEKCGEIATVRLSKKNFCHIRFELEQSIEAAIYLSGYRIRIGSNSDPQNIGRLHVDYAQARDDLYEFECRQRQHMREQRHRERIEKERLLPPSPPTIAIYSDHEAGVVAEKIKSDDAFIKGIHVLVAWLERGDCLKRNSTSFYSMIQSTNSHVRRLLNEKSQYEDELQKAKELMRQRVTGLLLQFSQIEKVFVSACHKKVWDHFTKPQRKNIEMWQKQASEIKAALLEEAMAERHDEEMELSDSETEIEKRNNKDEDLVGNGGSLAKKPRWEDSKAVNHLQEENDSLRCQLEASNNEVDMIKADLKSDMDAKDEELRKLQQKLTEQQDLLTRYLDLDSQSNACSSNGVLHKPTTGVECYSPCNNDIAGQCDSSSVLVLGSNNVNNNNSINPQSENNQSCSNINNSAEDNHHQKQGANNATILITEGDARIMGVISTFLLPHPFGASLDYIWSYTQKVLPTVSASQIETLMTKFPTLFRQETSGVGATLERKWVFVGFV